jgi:two-component system response regulator (stage 0 sporulation protein A)
MKNILVVEDNINFIKIIKDYFNNNDKINIKYICNDGEAGLKILTENKDDIDLILLDLVMPKKDGLYFLKELSNYDFSKNVIVMTSFNSDSAIRKVSSFGVEEFLLKPFSMEDLENKIIDSFETSNTEKINYNNLKLRITKLLHELGVPSHIKGYEYIREGILILYNNPSIIGGITKELYPEIASKYDTSVSRVERAIRHAIEVSWNRGNIDLMEEIFGHSVDIDRAKPTNSEFIVTLADKLKLERQLS